jgi:quercetin dioxygenase-like cupin family protein
MSLDIRRWKGSLEPNVRKLREELESEGYIVSEAVDAPGTVYSSHTHETDQSHWIISGEVEFEVNGETYHLSAGDRDLLPANTPHAAAVLGNKPVRYLVGVKSP